MRNDVVQLFGRLALGTILLSAVCDRLGLWGPYGTPNVSWGDFHHFTMYTAQVNLFLPSAFAPALAVLATIFEASFGIALILGIWTRPASIGTAVLTAIFGIAMAISIGIKKPLDFSVFGDSAAALFLAGIPFYRWSIDALLRRLSTRQNVERSLR